MAIEVYMISLHCNATGDTDTKLFFRKKSAYSFFNKLANEYCYLIYNNIHREEDFIWIAFAGGPTFDYTITINVQELCL